MIIQHVTCHKFFARIILQGTKAQRPIPFLPYLFLVLGLGADSECLIPVRLHVISTGARDKRVCSWNEAERAGYQEGGKKPSKRETLLLKEGQHPVHGLYTEEILA